MTPNPCLNADFYSISSEFFASPKAREKSCYSLVNRRQPSKVWSVCHDDRMVLFGIQEYIRRVLSVKVTVNDVVEAHKFLQHSHIGGGKLPFPIELWFRVVDEYDGYIPVKIKSLPEGSTFGVNVPYVQVISEEGFGELAAHIEAGLVGMVSIATARATLTRHLLERVKDYIREINPNFTEDEILSASRYFIHDFGMRASSCLEESEILGLAHLLSFWGTDTTNAAYLAHKLGCHPNTGQSILALAHRNVQGYDEEKDAFLSIKRAAESVK